MPGFENVDSGFVNAVLLVGGVGAAGGVVGGLLAGRKANVIASLLIGIIGGLVAAAVLRVLEIDPLISVGEELSAVYAALGGAFFAWVVGYST